MLTVEKTALPGLLILTPRRFGDHRGFFSETWNVDSYRKAGLAVEWVQDNHSFSNALGTLRGLHFQAQ